MIFSLNLSLQKSSLIDLMLTPSTKQYSRNWNSTPTRLSNCSSIARTRGGSRLQSSRRLSSTWWTYRTQLVTVWCLMKAYSTKKRSIRCANCGSLRLREKKYSSLAKKTSKDSYAYLPTSCHKWYPKKSNGHHLSTLITMTLKQRLTQSRSRRVNFSSSQSLNLKISSQPNYQNTSGIRFTPWQ